MGLAKSVAPDYPFFVLESVLVGATSLKILSGGWVPLLIGAIAVTILMTWKRGRELAKLEHDTLSLDLFVKSIGNSVHWVPGDAVFMKQVHPGCTHCHNKLHQRNILVTVVIEDVPFVAPEERITTETLAEHFFRIKIFYGFKDENECTKSTDASL